MSFSIFYIFSLLANLNQSHTFSSILYLTLLNTFQIFTYVPGYMMILTLVIFIIFLRTNNEFIILKEYLKVSTFLILITPIILFFSIIEINKSMILIKINNIQSELLESKDLDDLNIFIERDNESKSFIIFKNLNKKSNEILEYLRFEIINNTIVSGEYSENITIKGNEVLSNNLIIFEKENFIEKNFNNKILQNLDSFSNQTVSDNFQNDTKAIFDKINKFIFYILFYYIISLIFFSKKFILRNINQLNLFLLIFCLFFYYILIPTINLSFLNSYFHIIASIILSITFVKTVKYE